MLFFGRIVQPLEDIRSYHLPSGVASEDSSCTSGDAEGKSQVHWSQRPSRLLFLQTPEMFTLTKDRMLSLRCIFAFLIVCSKYHAEEYIQILFSVFGVEPS